MIVQNRFYFKIVISVSYNSRKEDAKVIGYEPDLHCCYYCYYFIKGKKSVDDL